MPRKYWTAVIAAFVVGLVLDFLMFRGAMAGAFRADEVAQMPDVGEVIKIVAEAVFVLPFVWVYGKGLEAGRSALGQGLRYGAAVGLMTFVPGALLVGAMVPAISETLLIWVAILGEVKMVALGALVSLLMTPAAA